MLTDIENKRKVVIAYDNSQISKEVFQWAKQNVFRPGQDKVIIFSNIEKGEAYMEPQYFQGFINGNWGIDKYKKYMDETSVKANNTLDDLIAELAELNVSASKLIVKGADVKKAIVDLTKNLPVDLLIVGSRGLHAVERVMLGSVSEYCMHHCHCPVLVHKGNGKH